MSTKMTKHLCCFVSLWLREGTHMKTHFEKNASEGCLNDIQSFRNRKSRYPDIVSAKVGVLLAYRCNIQVYGQKKCLQIYEAAVSSTYQRVSPPVHHKAIYGCNAPIFTRSNRSQMKAICHRQVPFKPIWDPTHPVME